MIIFEFFIGFIITVAIILLITRAASRASANTEPQSHPLYSYQKKSSILTMNEQTFYLRLRKAVSDTILIVPQAHLSSFLDHKIKGQHWQSAFRSINGKSVDFLLCDSNTLRPLFCIELDDATHAHADRQQRDALVNDILDKANLPLVRFHSGEWGDEHAIRQKIAEHLHSYDRPENH